MLYLKHFKTDSTRIEYEATATTKHVSYSIESDAAYIKAHKPYLTFAILSDGIISFSGYTDDGDINNEIQYSFDGGNTWSEPSRILTIDVHQGDEIKWKGRMKPKESGYNSSSGIGKFSGSTAQFNVKYDIMSLLYGDDFETETELVDTCTFANLFSYTNVVNANQLNLKSNNLTDYCYTNMFRYCSDLVEMPYLLAKNLAQYCYFQMFQNCINLTKTSALIAQEMKTSCYHRMFGNCTKLAKAPALLATIMANHCYEAMFQRCESLVTPPNLDSTHLANGCYDSMFQGCISLTKAPELPATSLSGNSGISSAYTHMFQECVLLTEAPRLPIKNINYAHSYDYMFNGCTNINYIYALFTTIPDDNRSITTKWVENVASTGIFVQNINATWGISGSTYARNSGLPSGWTVIYYDTALDKYYTDKQRSQECDDHGNPIN